MITTKAPPLAPLQHDVPIVDERGRPTPQFIQQWVKSRAVSVVVDETAVQVGTIAEELPLTYETQAHAAATYETIANAAATYETIANAAATYALISHAHSAADITSGNLSQARLPSGAVTWTATNVSFTGPVLISDGIGTAPGLAFASDPRTGLFSVGAGTYRFIAGGVLRFAGTTTETIFFGTFRGDGAAIFQQDLKLGYVEAGTRIIAGDFADTSVAPAASIWISNPFSSPANEMTFVSRAGMTFRVDSTSMGPFDAFKLSNTGVATFLYDVTIGATAKITSDAASNLLLNAPTGQFVRVTINGVGRLTVTDTSISTGILFSAGGGVSITGGSFAAGVVSKHATYGVLHGGVTGSSYDWAVMNPGATLVMGVPTGTYNMAFVGDIVAGAGKALTAAAADNLRLNAPTGQSVQLTVNAVAALTATGAGVSVAGALNTTSDITVTSGTQAGFIFIKTGAGALSYQSIIAGNLKVDYDLTNSRYVSYYDPTNNEYHYRMNAAYGVGVLVIGTAGVTVNGSLTTGAGFALTAAAASNLLLNAPTGQQVHLTVNGTAALKVGAAALGFYTTAPVAKPTGVAVSAAGIHAALVTLGLIAA